jgi:hypothetical protein
MPSPSSSSNRYADPCGAGGQGLPPEELEITRLIADRLRREDCMEAADRETIAYRIAEIMVSARQMYTASLPRLTNVNGESQATMDEDLEGLRMTFLHLRDLLHDFDSTFFAAMNHEPNAYNYDGEQPEEEDEAAEFDDDYELPT